MTIGEIARESGVGVETIRFYQREGLVAEPPRRGAAFRRYPPDVVRRVRFIRAAKDVGFSLKDIRELLAIRASDLRTCEKVKRRAEEKIEAIEEKLLELGRMRDEEHA